MPAQCQTVSSVSHSMCCLHSVKQSALSVIACDACSVKHPVLLVIACDAYIMKLSAQFVLTTPLTIFHLRCVHILSTLYNWFSTLPTSAPRLRSRLDDPDVENAVHLKLRPFAAQSVHQALHAVQQAGGHRHHHTIMAAHTHTHTHTHTHLHMNI